ncbi:MAG TPA: polysaccharide biosynthesis protein [Porphyromonadaceae bacterium]|nr:polysaccharide biosynthesis protein [Porphyromonadaceae bacterium]
MSIKALAKDTAIYGASSIIGKFLNWLLVPLYTYTMKDTAEYGIVTNLYAQVALLMVLLTYGMETTFFRFANKEEYDAKKVYSTTMISIFSTTLLFVLTCFLFLGRIEQWLNYQNGGTIISMMIVVLALDLLMSIPFCYLRYERRPFRFVTYKLIFIFLNIGLNLFLILLLPRWRGKVGWIDQLLSYPQWEVFCIVCSNLLATSIQFLFLLPTLFSVPLHFDTKMLGKMLKYTFPLLILGLAGMLNQTIDKILFPLLVSSQDAFKLLGIYGANVKIAVVIVMFIQAFRFAYEPYFFAQGKKKGEKDRKTLADAMKYFILFGWLIYLSVIVFLDIIKYFEGPHYYEGLRVVPIVMLSEMLFGVYFNLSVWYKLTDQTKYGAYFSLFGVAITFLLNCLLVPHWGYWGCALATFSGYFLMTLVSLWLGRNQYPIPYEWKRIGIYSLLALSFSAILMLIYGTEVWLRLCIGVLFLSIYLLCICKGEHILLKNRI